MFTDPELARWYDTFCGWERREDFDFYFPLVMSAASVLDVGCGTGLLLRRAREIGHRGRLVGLDPADAMLAVARERDDIEWVVGDLSSGGWEREFDLVVMTGHAFQVLVSDDELRAGLDAIRAALTSDGRFVFETRNPSVREWEHWTPANATDVADVTGRRVRMEQRVQAVERDTVRFTLTFSCSGWAEPRVSESTLRFLDADALSTVLTDAGLTVDEQLGDWDGSPLTKTSPEIITVTRRT